MLLHRLLYSRNKYLFTPATFQLPDQVATSHGTSCLNNGPFHTRMTLKSACKRILTFELFPAHQRDRTDPGSKDGNRMVCFYHFRLPVTLSIVQQSESKHQKGAKWFHFSSHQRSSCARGQHSGGSRTRRVSCCMIVGSI